LIELCPVGDHAPRVVQEDHLVARIVARPADHIGGAQVLVSPAAAVESCDQAIEEVAFADADLLQRQQIGKLLGGWAIYSTSFYNHCCKAGNTWNQR
jgi:hypothetical protein